MDEMCFWPTYTSASGFPKMISSYGMSNSARHYIMLYTRIIIKTFQSNIIRKIYGRNRFGLGLGLGFGFRFRCVTDNNNYIDYDLFTWKVAAPTSRMTAPTLPEWARIPRLVWMMMWCPTPRSCRTSSMFFSMGSTVAHAPGSRGGVTRVPSRSKQKRMRRWFTKSGAVPSLRRRRW